MAKDNTLGAPTEGLGQTVTFAGDTRQGTPQAQAAQRGALRNNATGGAAVRTAQALQVPPAKGDAIFETLSRLGSDILKPKLEAERTRMFFEGVNKAARGQAIQEIVDEQPWYSKVFGSSSLVDGARAHTASAKATSLATELEAGMGEFRKLSDQGAVKVVTERVGALASTGDSVTDAMIMQQATAAMAPILKNRTKAAINYQRELREEATIANYASQFARVQSAHSASVQPGATVDAGDALFTAIGAVKAMVREDGTSPELHSQMVSKAAMQAVNGGNLQAYQIIKASGKFDELTPQDQYQLTRAHSIAVNEAKGSLPASFRKMELDFALLSTTGANPEQVGAKAQQLNDEWRRLSGATEDYLQPRQVLAEQLQADSAERQRLAALARERAAAATRSEKEEKEIAFISEAFGAASRINERGSIMIGMDNKDQQAVFDHARVVLGQRPEEHMFFVANQANSGIYDKTLEQVHAAEINLAMRDNSAEALHQYWKRHYLPLVKASGGLGQVVAAHYAGAHSDVMAKYHSLASQVPEPDALRKEALASIAREPAPPKTDLGAFGKKVADELSTGTVMALWGKVTGKVPLDNPEGLAQLIAPKLSRNLPLDEAIAAYRKENQNLTELGGQYWIKPDGTTRVDSWLNANVPPAGGAPDGKISEATRLTIQKFGEAVGLEGGLQVRQTADFAGVPQLVMWGLNSQGQTVLTLFDGYAIHQTWREKQEADKRGPGLDTPFQMGAEAAKTNPIANVPLQFGPKSTWGVRPGDRSIYDTPPKK